jgi:hypothetical protein
MKKLLASLAAVSLLASPVFAQATNTASTTKASTKTMKTTKASTKASKPIAKAAKAEGESTATEAKEHKAAAKHKYGKYHRCASTHMKGHHKATHHANKAAAKTTKTTAAKTSG